MSNEYVLWQNEYFIGKGTLLVLYILVIIIKS